MKEKSYNMFRDVIHNIQLITCMKNHVHACEKQQYTRLKTASLHYYL